MEGMIKLKIIFTVNKYKPNLDGVQFVTSYLAEGLAKKGHEIIIVTSSFTRVKSPSNEKICGVNVIRKAIRTSHTFHLGNKKEYQEYILNITQDADCLINIGSQSPFTDWCFGIFNKISIPKVLYLHSIWDFKYHKENFENPKSLLFKIWANIRWKLYYKFYKKNFLSYDRVIQLHKKDYSYTLFKKWYNIDSLVIENAADNEFFEKKTNTNFKKPFDKYIIYVANFIDRKNQILAIKEFLKSNINPKIGLVLIGSSETSYYKKLVEFEKQERIKYGLSKTDKPILILTGVDRKLVSSYVVNSEFYLLTSKDEKYPISIVESMAASIPYISTDVGIVKYLPGGVVSLWNDLHYWIEIFAQEEQLRKNIGKTGYDYASKHMSIDKKVNQLEKIILELVKKEKNK